MEKIKYGMKSYTASTFLKSLHLFLKKMHKEGFKEADLIYDNVNIYYPENKNTVSGIIDYKLTSTKIDKTASKSTLASKPNITKHT